MPRVYAAQLLAQTRRVGFGPPRVRAKVRVDPDARCGLRCALVDCGGPRPTLRPNGRGAARRTVDPLRDRTQKMRDRRLRWAEAHPTAEWRRCRQAKGRSVTPSPRRRCALVDCGGRGPPYGAMAAVPSGRVGHSRRGALRSRCGKPGRRPRDRCLQRTRSPSWLSR